MPVKVQSPSVSLARHGAALDDLRRLTGPQVGRVVNDADARVIRANPRLMEAMRRATLDRRRPWSEAQVWAAIAERRKLALKFQKLLVKDLRHHGVDARQGPAPSQIQVGQRTVEFVKNVDDPYADLQWLAGLVTALVMEETRARSDSFVERHRRVILDRLLGRATDERRRPGGA